MKLKTQQNTLSVHMAEEEQPGNLERFPEVNWSGNTERGGEAIVAESWY